MSTLGYGMLPMLAIGFVGIFISLKSGLGIGVALAAAAWSSFAAGNFMDVLIKDSKDKKALIIYPLFLFYISFTMIVIF
jgi:protein YIPF6